MAEERKEYNTIEEENISGQETEEILKEDDENLTEKAESENCGEEGTQEETEASDEEKAPEKKGLFGKKKKDKKSKKSKKSAKQNFQYRLIEKSVNTLLNTASDIALIYAKNKFSSNHNEEH